MAKMRTPRKRTRAQNENRTPRFSSNRIKITGVKYTSKRKERANL